MPTTFSTALPAIATTTNPANACDMCRAESAGVRASTNQSETNAAPTLEMPSATTTSEIDQDATVTAAPSLVVACSLDATTASPGSRRIDAGSERTKTIRSTTAATSESDPS